MDEPREQPHPTDMDPQPLDDAELDAAAGGKRSEVKDSHDRHANIEVGG